MCIMALIHFVVHFLTIQRMTVEWLHLPGNREEEEKNYLNCMRVEMKLFHLKVVGKSSVRDAFRMSKCRLSDCRTKTGDRAHQILVLINNLHILCMWQYELSLHSKSNGSETEQEKCDWCFPAFRQWIQKRKGTQSVATGIFWLVNAFNWIRLLEWYIVYMNSMGWRLHYRAYHTPYWINPYLEWLWIKGQLIWLHYFVDIEVRFMIGTFMRTD